MSLNQKQNSLPFSVSVIVTEKNNLPCVELRRTTTDFEIIKSIVSCAFHGRPIIVMPVFNDKIRSVASLIEKGIIYKNKKDKQFYFTF